MPNMKYENLLPYNTVEDKIRIAQNGYAPMSGIVDEAAYLRKEAKSVD